MKNSTNNKLFFSKNKKRCLVAFASLSFIFSNSVLSLTLEQSVYKAMLTEPNLKQTFSRLQALLADKRYSQSDYYPTLTLTAGSGLQKYNDYNGRPLDDDAKLNQASLMLRQSIFSGLSTYHDVSRLGHEAQAERLKLFAEAKFVITDSFHGTCFSVNFGKPFVTISPGKKSNRISKSSKLVFKES